MLNRFQSAQIQDEGLKQYPVSESKGRGILLIPPSRIKPSLAQIHSCLPSGKIRPYQYLIIPVFAKATMDTCKLKRNEVHDYPFLLNIIFNDALDYMICLTVK